MLLAEPIFLSLQWEWPNTWKPSIFIRFFWCNKCCKWCDSLYAVNNTESLVEMNLDEVIEKIKEFNCNHIVFTWWEPALFEKEIAQIMLRLPRHTFEIETNWSIPLKNLYHQINISPKLSNSWNEPYKVRALEELPKITTRPVNVCFKYVAKWWKDFEDILENIKENNVPDEIVYIMPLGTDNESQINKDVLQFCLNNWFRYCQRMHILLFWNKKWV